MDRHRGLIKNEKNLPKDTPSKVEWISANIFVVSSWDGSLRFYEIANENNKIFFYQIKQITYKSPIIDFQFVYNYSLCLIGLLDGNLILLNLENFQEKDFSKMKNPILKILACDEKGFFLCFDFSRTLGIFKIENGDSLKYEFNKIVIDADISENIITCLFEDGNFCIVSLEDICDKKDIEYLNCSNETAAKKLSCIKIDNKNQILIIGMSSGRVIIYSYKNKYGSKFSLNKILLFRGHTKGSYLFNVNQMGFFSDVDNIFFTSGGDGSMKIWNYEIKKICSSFNFKAPVVSASYNNYLIASVVVTGYDWTEGIWKFQDINYRPNIEIIFHEKEDFIPQR